MQDVVYLIWEEAEDDGSDYSDGDSVHLMDVCESREVAEAEVRELIKGNEYDEDDHPYSITSTRFLKKQA